ncbi:MAG: hypothetical protein H8J66_02660 [Nitrospira sp.]|nr:hypothetical protein [Nitrospira sp.]
MIKDFVLCARAVEKNKFLPEPGLSFSLLAPRSTFSSSEQPNWLLAHGHNRKAIGESIQDQHSIYLDSPHVRIMTSQQSTTRLFARKSQLHTTAFALLANASQ